MTELTLHRLGTPGAPAMVLVHGLTDDGTNWPDAVERWRDRYDLVAVDLRGHGTSPRFEASQLADVCAVMQRDLEEVLASVGAPAVLVGHSLGGFLAARVALERPDLVRAAVLEDPAKPPPVDDPHFDITGFRDQQVTFVEAVTSHRADEVARMGRETPLSSAEIEAWADSKPRVDRVYLREGLRLTSGPWEQGLFSELTVPTLILTPVDGEMAPDPDLIVNPLVRCVDIEGAGHCVRRDRPEAYFAAVDAFLAGV
ncbi:hypothetical protein BW730_02460 [Tessaracoccus aquimaris]|uniref:AB hydrolase-1 domain-containing protein n=1 Tax=Tessaracoccus aquimaris TaxID=1332264 RepID=A0A1Q2CKJ1_9ACTN|nr:alpha/beta hydrolase [Tessaracoccus aquimaris]AQP46570.1 hypothetical protein BW730_02460 [Tessaracoccus aquimaris]